MNSLDELGMVPPDHYDPALPTGSLPTDNADVWIGRWPRILDLRVCWHTKARWEVLSHCYETPRIEVGGVLLGKVYRTSEDDGSVVPPLTFVEVSWAIRAQQNSASAGEFRFTPDAWAEINRTRDRDCPQLDIVGWYHTHPGHGLALGGNDSFIQNNYFGQAHKVALVIETFEHRGSFFVGSAKKGGIHRSEVFGWDHVLFQRILDLRRSDSQAGGPEQTVKTAVPDSELARGTAPEIIIEDHDLRGEPATAPDRSRSQSGQHPPHHVSPAADEGSVRLWVLVGILLVILVAVVAAIFLGTLLGPSGLSGDPTARLVSRLDPTPTPTRAVGFILERKVSLLERVLGAGGIIVTLVLGAISVLLLVLGVVVHRRTGY